MERLREVHNFFGLVKFFDKENFLLSFRQINAGL